jgi:hypothetical protein
MSTSPTRCCHSGLVRLATLNVFGSSGNWSDRLVVLRNGFLALDADLATLQETMVREEVDQAAAILGPGFSWRTLASGRRTAQASPRPLGGHWAALWRLICRSHRAPMSSPVRVL